MLNKYQYLRIFSPFAFFAMQVVYLVTMSPDPFLIRWIEGCFGFFLALVLANVIRARIAGPGDVPEEGGGKPPGLER